MNNFSLIDKKNLSLFAKGKYFHCYDTFGAQFVIFSDKKGVNFTCWAPFVKKIQIVGSFNNWQGEGYEMQHMTAGVWELFIPDLQEGDLYKFKIVTESGEILLKSDPFAFYAEQRPNTASRLTNLETYQWQDNLWLKNMKKTDHFKQPLNIYEVHLGSWKQHNKIDPENVDEIAFFTYRELAETLVPYAKEMGYTHLELLPIMEHPFDGSWGYQITGYYAPTSRYGSPQDFMYFVDSCHLAGIGVILDWVPGHFCCDAHGLAAFNGTKLYEQEKHLEWGTYKFDFGRGEVCSFLISNAIYWLEKYHIDGIRVDGVTSMVYLNYGVENKTGARVNVHGGDKNLEALEFLVSLNEAVSHKHPYVFMIAEESTDLPLVTYPPADGGLGFHYKWDMGWMNDTLKYMSLDFPFRDGSHNLLTFSTMYAFNENFILPLSHDEVVHGKCSLIGRMPGDYWRQFANLRLLYLYQLTHSGAMLNFMGNEIGQFIEWRVDESIEWFLLKYEKHDQYQHFIKIANHMYLAEKALWQQNYGWEGFEWFEADNKDQGIIIYKRQGTESRNFVIVVLNFHPESYHNYKIGVPFMGDYIEVFNTDKSEFGGSNKVNKKPIKATQHPMHRQNFSIKITVPPIGGIIVKIDI